MKKFFSEKQVYASAFFGGPIPPGILIFKNFKRLGEDGKALITLILTFVFTCLLFYGLFQLPEEITDKIPNIAFSSLYTIIVYLVYHKYLSNVIEERIEGDENKISNWNVTGITILGLLVNLLIIVIIGFSEPAFEGEKFEYGQTKNELFYDKGDFEQSELLTIAKVLTDFGYFDDEVVTSARVERFNSKYKLIIDLQMPYWTDPEILTELDNLKKFLKAETGREFILELYHYELSGETKKKQI